MSCLVALFLYGSAAEAASKNTRNVKSSGQKVSLFGYSLQLQTILDQLSRNQGLNLIIRNDVRANVNIDVPTLKEVELEDALRVVLMPLGYSYRIEGKDLVIFARAFERFRVSMPMIKQTWNSSISNDGSGGGSGGSGGSGGTSGGGSAGSTGTGASLSLTSESAAEGMWQELDTALKTMVSKDGRYAISATAGIVTVYDEPLVLDAVRRYINDLNVEMSRQAVVEVHLAEVKTSDGTQVGVDWNALVDRLVGSAARGLSIGMSNDSGFSLGGDGGFNFALSGVEGGAVIQALEQQGEVDIVSKPNVLVGNNQPAIIQAGEVLTYVSEVTQTQSSQGQSQLSVSTDVINDGVILSVVPRIDASGEVTLAVSTILQDVEQPLGDFRFGDNNFVQLPKMNRRSYSGVVRGRQGDTLIIAGLLGSSISEKSSGVPFLTRIPILGAFFGHLSVQESNSDLVIILNIKSVNADTEELESEEEASE